MGWRVNGSTHWLWRFTSENTTFYWVDRSRGSPALNRIFQEVFEGILVADFWAAYDVILGGVHPCCLFHLLNELAKVNQRNASEEWAAKFYLWYLLMISVLETFFKKYVHLSLCNGGINGY